jgi:hypothetical protein
MQHYFKRNWDDTTGQELTDGWGTSVYYFETDEELYPTRQMAIYESGQVLKYDVDFSDDEFGGLGDQPLDEEDFKAFSITKEEFETTWKELNRRTE